MRIMVYGDSNSWGLPPDGSRMRMAANLRWPHIMASELGADLVEEALPGRTTALDDPEMLGHAMNGLRHLPVALRSNSPLDWMVIMLGTNDFKSRFRQTPVEIARNISRLVACAVETGGGIGSWDDAPAPRMAIIVPPPLSAAVDDPNWENHEQWVGARETSIGLAAAITDLSPALDVPVFDAGLVVSGSDQDPIHLDTENHRILGKAVANWLCELQALKPQT